MKTILLLTPILFSCLSTSIAQIRKGGWMTTGTIGFHNTQSEDLNPPSGFGMSGVKNFSFDVSGGYFATQSLAFGIDLYGNLQVNKSEQTGSYYEMHETHFKTIVPGVFTRYYLPVGQKFNFYFEGGVAGGSTKIHTISQVDSSSPTTDDYKAKNFNVRLSAGANYFLSNHFALECNVGSAYWSKRTEVDTEDMQVSRSWNLEMGLRNLRFGVLFFFGGSRELRPSR